MINTKQMPILIDCLGVIVGEQRGALRSISGLIEEIGKTSSDSCIIWVNGTSRHHFQAIFGRERCIVAPISGRNRTVRILWQILIGPLLAKFVRPRIYVSTAVFPMLGFSCPTAAFLRDLIQLHFPEVHGKISWLLRRGLLGCGIRTVSAVFTVSQASATDIASRFGKRVGSIFIVPNGVDSSSVSRTSQLRDEGMLSELGLDNSPFVLSVLGGHLYKNPVGLAQAAYVLCARGRSQVKVVVVGDAVQQYRTIPHPHNLLVLGIVDDRTLEALYRTARALVYPTFLEGFGRPVVEAQAVGIPVVCSDIPVLREVSGGAAIFVDPSQPSSIAEGILTAIDDPARRAALVQMGYENATRYTWQRSVEAFVDACDCLVSLRTQSRVSGHVGHNRHSD